MKKSNLSVAEVNKLIQELKDLMYNTDHFVLLDQNQILTDQDLCKLFKISTRTLRRYRKKGEFRYIQISRNYYYFKSDINIKIIEALHSEK